MAQLWLRPWVLLGGNQQYRRDLPAGEARVAPHHDAGLWVYVPADNDPDASLAALGEVAEVVAGFTLAGNNRLLAQLPLPLRSAQGLSFRADGVEMKLSWPELPDKPAANSDPDDEDAAFAQAIMRRAEAVWDRLRDVDMALADPTMLWAELRRRWTKNDDVPPQMDIIVQQLHSLSRTLDELERRPRQILRRRHRQVPIARAQELDRRAIAWLVRQPGDTLAERAGDRQRILAVAREENFDTLENRVLRAYAELARRRSREYEKRNVGSAQTQRVRQVAAFSARCRHLSRSLADHGVRLAEAGVLPNFVLQQNPNYHRVWAGWQELLAQEKVRDDLWRWQGRSWEEFSALALMVALVGVPGAQLVASSPLVFRDEQRRGSWIEHDNPLGVFYLQAQQIVFEVQYRDDRISRLRADFAAPIWIAFAPVDDQGFISYLAVWPLWSAPGGIVADEGAEVDRLLGHPEIRKGRIKGAIVIRPAEAGGGSEYSRDGRVLTVTLGTEREALWQGIDTISDHLTSFLKSKD